MVKLALVITDGFEYPAYKDDGKYYVDLGGSFGMSDPLSFEGDTKAIAHLRKVLSEDPYEC